MSQENLKRLRLLAPGVIIFIFYGILGHLTGFWTAQIPTNFRDVQTTPAFLVPAGLYYFLPFRRLANRRYHKRVIENLRSGLVRISGFSDNPKLYTWATVSSIFYYIVDRDNSLTKKSSLAYFNGFFWKLCADIRVISYIYFLISVALRFISLYFLRSGIGGSTIAAALFLTIALLSYAGSEVTTRRQVAIGDEQVETIRLFYQQDLIDALGNL